jgi:hypothetical protein
MLTKRHLAGSRVAPLIAMLTLTACATQEEPQTIYCYRTLADIGCYTQPDRGRESRLVGTYQRHPGSDGANDSDAVDDAPSDRGALARWLGASLELAGRLVSPIGSVVGLVVDP